jgi:hypothetical protein
MSHLPNDDQDLLSRVVEAARVAPVDQRVSQHRGEGRSSDPGLAWTLPGIAGRTRVLTNFGRVPAQLVRVGDMLRTRSGTFLRVQDVEVYKLDRDFLARHPHALPVIIRQGSLGGRAPSHDIFLSPGQAVASRGGRLVEHFVAAAELTRHRGGFDPAVGELTYHRFHLSEPADVDCEGAWVRMA